MGSQDYLNKMQLRQNYRNFWHTDLKSTIQADTPRKPLSDQLFCGVRVVADCCFAFWCGPCASYVLHKRALNDMSRYVCCAGYMPCSGRCGESRCPPFCLCTEGLCMYADTTQSRNGQA